MSFWESFILGLVPGILGGILNALNAGGKLSPNAMAILQSIDASLDALLDAPAVVVTPAPPATPAAK